MTSVKEAFKDSFSHYFKKTTVHAIPNVFRDDVKTIVKFFWFILFLVGLAGCVYCN